MFLKEEIKKYRKDWVHRNYARIVENFANYDNISRKKMVEEIIKVYEKYGILEICSYEELMFLEKVFNNKIKLDSINENEKMIERELANKFLLIHSSALDYEIPEEFKKEVELAIKNHNKKLMIQTDHLNDLLIGLMKIYGIISPEDLLEILQEYIEIDEEDYYIHINTNKYFLFYVYSIDYIDQELLVYEPYYQIEEEILANIDEDLPYKIRNVNEVLYLKKHEFNDSNQNIANFLEEVNKLPFFQFTLFDAMESYVVLNLDRQNLIKAFKSIPILKNYDLHNVIDLMERAMDSMPSAVLKGHTREEYNNLDMKKAYDDFYNLKSKKLQKRKDIIEYRNLKEEYGRIIDSCMMYCAYNHLENRFLDIVAKNNLIFDFEHSSIVGNFILFHRIDNEPTVFEEFFQKNITVLHKDYSLCKSIKESYYESLFIIKKLDPNKALVTLEDTETNKEIIVKDIALSCSSEIVKGCYLYAPIITIKEVSFIGECAFILEKNKHKDISKEIQNKIKTLKGIKNPLTKKYIACYLIFRQNKNIFYQEKELV